MPVLHRLGMSLSLVPTSPPLYSLTCPAVNSTTGRLAASMPAVLNSARSAHTVTVTVLRLQCRAGSNYEGLLLRQRVSSLAHIRNCGRLPFAVQGLQGRQLKPGSLTTLSLVAWTSAYPPQSL